MSEKYDEMKESLKKADKVMLDKRHNLTIEYKVHSVKYWEPITPRVKNKLPLRKFYVDIVPRDINGLTEECYPGTVAFDINTKSWHNKDFLYNLDYNELEKRVLEVSGVQSLEELYYTKRKAWKDYMVKSQNGQV